MPELAPPQEDDLTFQEDEGRLIAFRRGRAVILGREFPTPLRPGEVWRVRLHPRERCDVAEPICRIAEAPPVPDAPLRTLASDPHLASDAPTPTHEKNPMVSTLAPAYGRGAHEPTPAPHRAQERHHPDPDPPPKGQESAAARPIPSPRANGAGVSAAALTPERAEGAHKPATFQGMLVEPHDVIRPADRVAIFVDASNTSIACRTICLRLDWAKARDYFLGRGRFVCAFYHVADYGDEGNQHGFFEALANEGFVIRRKPAKVIRAAPTGETRYKANVDIEIALDMLQAAETYDAAFLFSGNSDFERPIEALRARGKRIYIVSSRATLSSELLFAADKPVFHLEDFATTLAR